jgi:peptide/nickel transport system ATP-binding protein
VSAPYLDVRDLRVGFPTEDGLVQAVDGVSFAVARGQTLAVVGESGSGKSVTSLAIMGLLNRRRTALSGEVVLAGDDLLKLEEDEVRALRGARMAMIFQDPLSSLHPYYKIGRQLVEAVLAHQRVSKEAARARALELLQRVGIPNARERLDAYPHQLSGGMRQRVMIAMALVNDPDLIIADEPTTALDVTVQAQIIELLKGIQDERGTAIVIITHDLGVVADVADQVVVMYGGRVVERGTVEDIYYRAQMPYTWGLLGSIARLDGPRGQRLRPIKGQPPSLIRLPKGCVFRPRCDFHQYVEGNRCDVERPELLSVEYGHESRCFLTKEQKVTLAKVALRGTAADTSIEHLPLPDVEEAAEAAAHGPGPGAAVPSSHAPAMARHDSGAPGGGSGGGSGARGGTSPATTTEGAQ